MTDTTITLDMTDATAKALVDTIKSAVNGAGKYAAYVKAHNVTRDTVKVHAAALAVLTYPNEKPVQKVDGKRTKFGNTVQAAGNGLRAALGKEDKEAVLTDYLAALVKAADKAVENGVEGEAIKAALAQYL